MPQDREWQAGARELAAGELRMLIDGQQVASSTGRFYDVFDPAHGQCSAWRRTLPRRTSTRRSRL
ncbi:MAG: hypothetical protein ACRDPY_25845 [Streptosporangiaceae bacterium]